MNSPIDAYTIRARLQPGLLAAVPLAVGVTAFFPEGPSWWTWLWAVLVASGGTFLLGELARQVGKAKEAGLFSSWGGKPTTVLLRHRSAPNPVKLTRYHARLRELRPDLELPTAESEQAQPAAADHVYEAATDYLKERARGDALVFQANCEYGFRRNALGVRPYGIATSLIGFLANVGALVAHLRFGVDASVAMQVVAASVNGILLAVWLLAIKPVWVKTTAFGYAERLLATLETLQPVKGLGQDAGG